MLTDYTACASDTEDVRFATLEGLHGLLSKKEATCMKQCSLLGLLFIVCCRLTPPIACLTGMMYFPEAISHLKTVMPQGPLPSISQCFKRQQKLKHPSAWGIAVPAGPRDEFGDLSNTSLADLALILALGLCDKGLDLMSVEKLNIGTQQNSILCGREVAGYSGTASQITMWGIRSLC